MLPRAFRVPGEVIRSGGFKKVFSSPFFTLTYATNNVRHNRFAVVVSSRAVPTSIRRHFFKRFFFDRAGLWPNLGADFLFIVSPAVESGGRELVEKKIRDALRAAEVKLGGSPPASKT